MSLVVYKRQTSHIKVRLKTGSDPCRPRDLEITLCTSDFPQLLKLFTFSTFRLRVTFSNQVIFVLHVKLSNVKATRSKGKGELFPGIKIGIFVYSTVLFHFSHKSYFITFGYY